MIKVKEKKAKGFCQECKKSSNSYRKIYHVLINNCEVNLCTECMLVLNSAILYQFHSDISDRNSDSRIREKLRLLLNKRVSDSWSNECQSELDSIDPKLLSNSDRLIYKQIQTWED